MIFNQCLPHGNTHNREKETRWSLNCRFKSVFSPYADKIGEFFEPVTLHSLRIAIKCTLPKSMKTEVIILADLGERGQHVQNIIKDFCQKMDLIFTKCYRVLMKNSFYIPNQLAII